MIWKEKINSNKENALRIKKRERNADPKIKSNFPTFPQNFYCFFFLLVSLNYFLWTFFFSVVFFFVFKCMSKWVEYVNKFNLSLMCLCVYIFHSTVFLWLYLGFSTHILVKIHIYTLVFCPQILSLYDENFPIDFLFVRSQHQHWNCWVWDGI